jgi:hypothetical protein
VGSRADELLGRLTEQAMGELVDGNNAAGCGDGSAEHPRRGGREIPRAHRAILSARALSAGKGTNKLVVQGPKRRISNRESHAS